MTDYQKFWDRFHDSGYYNPSQRHRFRLIFSEVSRILKKTGKPAASVRILDLGCGLGHLIYHLNQKYPEIHFRGVDISEKAIAEMRQTLPGVLWDVMDIQKPVEDRGLGSYDIVICSEVLEHCERPGEVIANAARFTVPGGWAIITVPGGGRYRIDHDLGHLRHYRLEDVKGLFRGHPLELTDAYAWGWPFLNLMRWMVDKLYKFTTQKFLDTQYDWKQKGFCQCLYLLMFANIRGAGCQLAGVFRKSAQPKNA